MRIKPLHAALFVGLLMMGGGALWLAYAPEPATGAVPDAIRAPAGQVGSGEGAAPHTDAVAMPEYLLAGDRYKDVMQRIRARRAGAQWLFPDDNALVEARERQVLFSASNEAKAAARSSLSNERRSNDGRDWIAYDMQVLAARAEGDRFLLPLPGAMAVLAEIDAVDVLPGQYRWSGRLLDQSGGTFHITQVFEDAYAIGTINTPTGEYLLEVKAGHGWVTDAAREFTLPPGGKDTVGGD